MWERGLFELTDPTLIEFVKEKIREIGDVTLTPLEQDAIPQSACMLSDG
jgi:hypothetical protein